MKELLVFLKNPKYLKTLVEFAKSHGCSFKRKEEKENKVIALTFVGADNKDIPSCNVNRIRNFVSFLNDSLSDIK